MRVPQKTEAEPIGGSPLLRRALLLVLAAFGAAGCQPSYLVKVDSVVNQAPRQVSGSNGSSGGSGGAGNSGAAKTAPNKRESYTIKNRNTTNAEETLRYKEAVDYVKKALATKGLYEARSTAAADLLVEVDYGLDQPRTTMEERLVPIYSKAGGGVRYEERVYTLPNGTTTTRTVPVYDPPGTRLIGEEWVVIPITTYEKFLKIIARENRSDSGTPAQIWSVTVTNEDESNDLRKYIPILVSAAIDHLGGSNGQTTVRLTDQSDDVAYIKGGL